MSRYEEAGVNIRKGDEAVARIRDLCRSTFGPGVVGDVGLFNTVARRRVGTVRDDRVTETGTGVFAEAESRWTAFSKI